MSNTILLDTPEQIAAFRLLAIRRALKLEVTTGLRSRLNAAVRAARAVLEEKGKNAPRTKKALLAALESHLTSIGIPFNP
jgi:hypothetical protein